MGKFATAFRGVWGQVRRVDYNPPPPLVLGKKRIIDGRSVPGADGGANHTELYIQAYRSYRGLPLTQGGKYVVIKASPYELDGGVLDDRPILAKAKNRR